jgi:AcrR family transcriptional regulator
MAEEEQAASRGRTDRPGGARERLLDAGIAILTEASPDQLLGFIGPNVVAARASSSTGALYHHWPDGQAAFLTDLVDEVVDRTVADISERLADATTVDDLASGLVGALAGSPLLRICGALDIRRLNVHQALGAVLAKGRRRPREPWTIDGVAFSVLSLALGAVALAGDDLVRAESIVSDGLRALLAMSCAPNGDGRDFDVVVAESEGRQGARFLRSPGVSLGLGES